MNGPDDVKQPPREVPANLPEPVKPVLPPEVIKRPPGAQPTFADKMFKPIKVSGWVQLGLVCVAVGAIFEAGGVNPFAPGFSFGAAFGQMIGGLFNVIGWAATVAWRPLLLGAAAVLPLWLLWRVGVALFGKHKPAPLPQEPHDLSEPYRPQSQSKRWPDVV